MDEKSGLSSQQAAELLAKFGPNAIEEKKESLLLKILGYFWGPIPWMIEIAAILSAVIKHWPDFIIIMTLLIINAVINFWEEFQAGNAIAALKKNLALKCSVKRDGKWIETNAANLVPGDVIRLRIGNIIPADAKLDTGDYLSVDQSTLTGESLPVDKKVGDDVYSGSIAKKGEMTAIVTGTGKNTYFGKTAGLVEKAKPVSHFRKAVLQIGRYLIYISIALAVVLVIIQLLRGDKPMHVVEFVLVLIIASIPVAMPAVLSVTMALGALRLSRMKAVVTRLESIEEMAGVDVLCSDKTGTLTQNKLTLGKPLPARQIDEQTVVLYGALASEADTEDPIDLAIIRGLKSPDALKEYTMTKFVPFDPVSKKSEAHLKDSKGGVVYAAKGAPQVILAQCHPDPELEKTVNASIEEMSKKGNRTLGVARSNDGKNWEFLGLLPLYDPLREDSAATIADAEEHGIQIKMLTGDNIAIAREIGRQLKLGDNITVAAKDLTIEEVEKSDGFAQVYPEHKYDIVKMLQDKKHIVGMTGDGVNDAPALKQADVGIAVSGATDAARSAASLVILAPGLSVITRAIEEARRIFERMNTYATYRITETIRVMLFMVASILAFNFYPVNALMIIMLALLNDIPIMTIVYDHTIEEKKPVHWKMKKVLTIATSLGIVGIIETFLLLIIAMYWLKLTILEIQSFIFLKLSLAGHETLFVVRVRQAFYRRPFPSPILLSAILATQAFAACLVGFGWFIPAIPWSYVGLIWAYTLVWMFIEDRVKIFLYRHIVK